MSLSINTLRKQQEAEEAKMPTWTADRRLYYAALPNGLPDKSHLVEEGDPSAAWLFVPVGHPVLEADAIRYGLLKKPEEKQAEPVANKAMPAPANKRRAAP